MNQRVKPIGLLFYPQYSLPNVIRDASFAKLREVEYFGSECFWAMTTRIEF
jgi:hypothetical protein